jgi:hypothetical protein
VDRSVMPSISQMIKDQVGPNSAPRQVFTQDEMPDRYTL